MEELSKNELNEVFKEVPIINTESDNFQKELEFNIWTTHSCSDYRNDRERPYNGQPWTDGGERGKQIVSGLTMRDLVDCLIKAMIESSSSNKYLNEDFFKCWNFETNPPTPTQFLLDRQNETEYISTKVDLGIWRPQDVYKLNWDDIDPIAITQNFTCEVEKMMGIFPNIGPILEKLKETL